MLTMQAKTLLLKASQFKSLEALLEVFKDFEGGTGIIYLRTQPQPKRDDLVPCEVDGIKDIRDQETGTTLRSYLTQAYLNHKAPAVVSLLASLHPGNDFMNHTGSSLCGHVLSAIIVYKVASGIERCGCIFVQAPA